jgi:hypothetical protein
VRADDQELLDLLGVDPDELVDAIEQYRAFHWGEAEDGLVVLGADHAPHYGPELLFRLGEIPRITYQTSKNGEIIEWVHEFTGDLPVLCANARSSRLAIVGGSYTVEPEGIKG